MGRGGVMESIVVVVILLTASLSQSVILFWFSLCRRNESIHIETRQDCLYSAECFLPYTAHGSFCLKIPLFATDCTFRTRNDDLGRIGHGSERMTSLFTRQDNLGGRSPNGLIARRKESLSWPQ
jgi:hypothetical protein